LRLLERYFSLSDVVLLFFQLGGIIWLQHQQPVFVTEAESAAAVLSRQFDVVVDPDGRLIHARRRTSSTSDNAMFVHCPPAAALGAKHNRLERLLEARARLELTRLVAEQVKMTLALWVIK